MASAKQGSAAFKKVYSTMSRALKKKWDTWYNQLGPTEQVRAQRMVENNTPVETVMQDVNRVKAKSTQAKPGEIGGKPIPKNQMAQFETLSAEKQAQVTGLIESGAPAKQTIRDAFDGKPIDTNRRVDKDKSLMEYDPNRKAEVAERGLVPKSKPVESLVRTSDPQPTGLIKAPTRAMEPSGPARPTKDDSILDAQWTENRPSTLKDQNSKRPAADYRDETSSLLKPYDADVKPGSMGKGSKLGLGLGGAGLLTGAGYGTSKLFQESEYSEDDGILSDPIPGSTPKTDEPKGTGEGDGTGGGKTDDDDGIWKPKDIKLDEEHLNKIKDHRDNINGDIDMFNHEAQSIDRVMNDEVAEAKAEYQLSKDKIASRKLADGIIRAVGYLVGAFVGKQTGTNMSGLKLEPSEDFGEERKMAFQELQAARAEARQKMSAEQRSLANKRADRFRTRAIEKGDVDRAVNLYIQNAATQQSAEKHEDTQRHQKEAAAAAAAGKKADKISWAQREIDIDELKRLKSNIQENQDAYAKGGDKKDELLSRIKSDAARINDLSVKYDLRAPYPKDYGKDPAGIFNTPGTEDLTNSMMEHMQGGGAPEAATTDTKYPPKEQNGWVYEWNGTKYAPVRKAK